MFIKSTKALRGKKSIEDVTWELTQNCLLSKCEKHEGTGSQQQQEST